LPDRLIDLLGFLAGTLTTVSFVPQVAKAWRTKSTGDLSLAMLVTFTAGVLFWLIYGLALESLPMVLTNAVTLILSGLLLALKLRGV
jgi:MtN3 and saliva related transmembrane protein